MRSRAAVLTGVGNFALDDFEVPTVGTDDAVLRVEASGVCGSDYEVFEGRLKSTSLGTFSIPLILGHEPVGRIHSIGPLAEQRWGVTVGDRVAVYQVYTCGRCPGCVAEIGKSEYELGMPKYCTATGVYGLTGLTTGSGLWGAMSEYMYLSAGSTVAKLRDDIPPEQAVAFNPLGAGFAWAVERPGLRAGQSIAILGCGQRGLSAVIAAREAGASFIAVTGLTRDSHKLDLALQLGATLAIDVERDDPVTSILSATEDRGVDVVLDVVPYATNAVDQAVEIVAYGGTIVLAGTKLRPMMLDTDRILHKCIVVMGAEGITQSAFRTAVSYVNAAHDQLASFHTHTYGLHEAARAMEVLSGARTDGPPAIHVAVIPQDKT